MSKIERCSNDYKYPHRHIAIIHNPEPGDAVFADFSGALAITVRDSSGCIKSIAMVYLDMFDWESQGAYVQEKEQFRAKDFYARQQHLANLIANRKVVDTTKSTRHMIEALSALEEEKGDSLQVCYIYQKTSEKFFSENAHLGMIHHCEKLKKYLEREISPAHSNINCTPVFLRIPSLGNFALDSRGRLVSIAALSHSKKILERSKEKAAMIQAPSEKEWVLGEDNMRNSFFLKVEGVRVTEIKPGQEASDLNLVEPKALKAG